MSEEDQQSSATGEQISGDDYVVIARRYRPQTFTDLIGQEHVAEALQAAIATNRVGHAYLFTGARGVGKTSAARILAAALNASGDDPGLADIREAIFRGEDLDVLEIDGASNRGIDEIRQLRSNVNSRPSRSRLKIYIIDEVHMLTREAFNALLKTLEEPPEHVKFIFCTTEPGKIPITVISRCQRFDFAGIESESIVTRLRQIAEAEGTGIDADALELLARRADGSMRDGQSLLEQLLAFTSEQISAATVHRMLGTAESTRLLAMARRFATHDAGGLLVDLDTAIREGVDVGNLLEQLLGVFRDCMTAQAGCGPETFLHVATDHEVEAVREIADQLGMETVLAILQILQQAVGDMHYSTQRRSLAEVALVRAAQLEDLEQLSALIAQLSADGSPDPMRQAETPRPQGGKQNPSEPKKKSASSRPKTAAASNTPQPSQTSLPAQTDGGDSEKETAAPGNPDTAPPATKLTTANVQQVWTEALEKISDLIRANAQENHCVIASAENALAVSFEENCSFSKSICERPENTRKIESAVSEVVGAPVRVVFTIAESATPTEEVPPERPTSRKEKMSAVAENPMVRQAQKLFGARPTSVD